MSDPQAEPVRIEVFGGVAGGTADSVEGELYRGRDGYLFKDAEGQQWWIMFAADDREPTSGALRGRILACTRLDEEATLEVRVLATGVRKPDAGEAFRQFPPASFEDAVLLAGKLHEETR